MLLLLLLLLWSNPGDEGKVESVSWLDQSQMTSSERCQHREGGKTAACGELEAAEGGRLRDDTCKRVSIVAQELERGV